jgi:uncharacterized protein YukE
VKKLSKVQIEARAGWQTQLAEVKSKLETAIDEFNGVVASEFEKVQTAREAYNEVIENLEAWRSDIHGDMETYQDERSDKWKEGDAGQNYETWMEAYGEELSTLDEFELPELEMPELLDESALDEYPDEP